MSKGIPDFAHDIFVMRRELHRGHDAADALLDLAHDLEVKLPGTRAAFYDGGLRQSKVGIIVRATAVLDPAEARAARSTCRAWRSRKVITSSP